MLQDIAERFVWNICVFLRSQRVGKYPTTPTRKALEQLWNTQPQKRYGQEIWCIRQIPGCNTASHHFVWLSLPGCSIVKRKTCFAEKKRTTVRWKVRSYILRQTRSWQSASWGELFNLHKDNSQNNWPHWAETQDPLESGEKIRQMKNVIVRWSFSEPASERTPDIRRALIMPKVLNKSTIVVSSGSCEQLLLCVTCDCKPGLGYQVKCGVYLLDVTRKRSRLKTLCLNCFPPQRNRLPFEGEKHFLFPLRIRDLKVWIPLPLCQKASLMVYERRMVYWLPFLLTALCIKIFALHSATSESYEIWDGVLYSSSPLSRAFTSAPVAMAHHSGTRNDIPLPKRHQVACPGYQWMRLPGENTPQHVQWKH